MSSCITLKEARKQLTCAAFKLAPTVKEALEVWLQVADNLPKHLQLPSTAAATDLVQAALQQAPWPMQEQEPRQVAWLQKHLPEISAAMLMSLSTQVDINVRRIGILQSLPSMAGSAQVSATIYTERTAHLLSGILARVFHLVAPVAMLCTELHASASNVRSHMEQGHDHPQHRLQQGNNLISSVATGLSNIRDMIGRVYTRQLKACDGLMGRGSELTSGPVEVVASVRTCEHCVLQAAGVLVCSFGLTAEQLQAAGMPAAQAQQLLSDAAFNVKRYSTSVSTHSADTKLRSRSSTEDSSSEEGLGSGAGADAGAGDGVADGDDGGLDDMQALLQQMYGCTFQVHNSAPA